MSTRATAILAGVDVLAVPFSPQTRGLFFCPRADARKECEMNVKMPAMPGCLDAQGAATPAGDPDVRTRTDGS